MIFRVSSLLSRFEARYSKALLTGILASVLVACDSDQPEVEVTAFHEQQALAYIESGQYRAASIEARNVIQKAPEKSRGYILMATILNDLGHYKSALDALDSAPETSRSNWDYVAVSAEALLGRGKFNSAITLLNANIAYKADEPIAYSALQGQILYGLGQFEAAEQAFKELLTSINRPIIDSERELFDISMAHLIGITIKQKDTQHTEELLTELEAGNPQSTRASILRARQAIAKQDLAAAENILTDTLITLQDTDTITPQRANILQLLADVLIRQGRSAEALVYTQLLADAFPGHEIANEEFDRASKLYRDGEKQEAQEILEKLVADHPGFEKASVLLAIMRFENGNYEGAGELFATSVDAEINDEEITRITAATFLKLNQPQLVLDLIGPIIKSADNSQLLAMHGSAALALSKNTQGLNSLSRALEIDANNVFALTVLANYYRSPIALNLALAQNYLERAHESSPKNVEIGRELVKVMINNDQRDAAQNIIEKLIKADPDNAQPLILAGDFYLTNNQLDEAAKFYDKAIALDNNDAQAQLKRTELGVLRNEPFEINQQRYLQTIKLAPNSLMAYQRYIAYGIEKQQFETVKAQLDRLAAQPTYAGGAAILGMYFAQNNDIATAQLYLERVNQYNEPAAVRQFAGRNINQAIALSHLQSGDLGAARESANKALEANPKDAQVLALLTDIEISVQNYGEAERLAGELLSINKPLGEQLTGDIARSQQQWQKAVDHYRQAWKQIPSESLAEKLYLALQKHAPEQNESFVAEWQATLPESISVKRIRARELLTQQEYSKAVRVMESIYEAAPNDASNLNNLAWALDQLGDTTAANFAKQAYELAPENADIIDTYGWILYRNGDSDSALALLEKASTLAPNNAAIKQHLNTVKASR